MRCTHPQTAHGRCDSRAIGPEPEFDAERVVWDDEYRRIVIARLREWHLMHGETSGTTISESEAA